MSITPGTRTNAGLAQLKWVALFAVVFAVHAAATEYSLRRIVERIADGSFSAVDQFVSLSCSVLSLPVFPIADHVRLFWLGITCPWYSIVRFGPSPFASSCGMCTRVARGLRVSTVTASVAFKRTVSTAFASHCAGTAGRLDR